MIFTVLGQGPDQSGGHKPAMYGHIPYICLVAALALVSLPACQATRAADNIDTKYRCDNGTVMGVSFTYRPEHTATVRFNRNTALQMAPAQSKRGFVYKDRGYLFKGRGRKATWIPPNSQPLSCVIVPDKTELRLEPGTLRTAQN